MVDCVKLWALGFHSTLPSVPYRHRKLFSWCLCTDLSSHKTKSDDVPDFKLKTNVTEFLNSILITPDGYLILQGREESLVAANK